MRFTRIFLAAPLALGLMHCVAEDEAAETVDPIEQEPVQQLQAIDAKVPCPDDGGKTDAGTSDAGTSAPFTLTSSAVKEGERIDNAYRCNVDSPALAWSAGPAATKGYALVFKDQGNGFTHWVLYDLPASTRALPKGVPVGPTLTQPAGAKQSPNWSGRAGYGGPCGGMSTYVFTLYALDVATLPDLAAGATSAQVIKTIESHALGKTTLSITSSR